METNKNVLIANMRNELALMRSKFTKTGRCPTRVYVRPDDQVGWNAQKPVSIQGESRTSANSIFPSAGRGRPRCAFRTADFVEEWGTA